MEPSGRNRGNWSQMGPSRKRLKQAVRQPLATHGNRFGAHGKEGVNGSSPLEGFTKGLQTAFLLPQLRTPIARASLLELRVICFYCYTTIQQFIVSLRRAANDTAPPPAG